MVREARLLWDSSSIPKSDADRLRRLERGDDVEFDPGRPPARKRRATSKRPKSAASPPAEQPFRGNSLKRSRTTSRQEPRHD